MATTFCIATFFVDLWCADVTVMLMDYFRLDASLWVMLEATWSYKCEHLCVYVVVVVSSCDYYTWTAFLSFSFRHVDEQCELNENAGAHRRNAVKVMKLLICYCVAVHSLNIINIQYWFCNQCKQSGIISRWFAATTPTPSPFTTINNNWGEGRERETEREKGL